MKRITLLIMVTVLLLSCGMFSSTSTPTPSLLPTSETPNPLPEPTDRTQLLVVAPGEAFDIVVPSNPSTGYRWQLTRELDANFVQLLGQTFISEEPVLPGSGGVEVWTFGAVAPGETNIELGYYPPGNDTQPDDIAIFSIRIE